MVSVGNDSQSPISNKVLETRTADERFSKNVKRLETATCWYRFGRVARRGRAYWSNAMENVGVAAAINDVAQALADPQVRHRRMQKVPHPLSEPRPDRQPYPFFRRHDTL